MVYKYRQLKFVIGPQETNYKFERHLYKSRKFNLMNLCLSENLCLILDQITHADHNMTLIEISTTTFTFFPITKVPILKQCN